MSSFERIVRPFQNGDVFNARVLPPAQITVDVNPPVHVEWGGTQDTDYVEEPSPTSMGFQSEWNEDKSQRVSDTVRVENPDDATQAVNVERIKKMVLVNNRNGDQLTIQPDFT